MKIEVYDNIENRNGIKNYLFWRQQLEKNAQQSPMPLFDLANFQNRADIN